ncbi:MAG: hypothetical protein MHM6MM_004807 [Cercozoa sp. M6MM]
MFMPKSAQHAILQYIFTEGVLVVKKDANLPQHQDIPVPNLYVMMMMKRLASKKLVEVTFNWQYNYCKLLPAGVEYLRDYLALPETVVPQTYIRSEATPRPRERDARGRPSGRGGRDSRN